jgi:hypothetical protein
LMAHTCCHCCRAFCGWCSCVYHITRLGVLLCLPRFTRPLTRCMLLQGGHPSGGSGAGSAPWHV